VPRVKYAMNYRPKNSFSMSYASRLVIFPGVALKGSELWWDLKEVEQRHDLQLLWNNPVRSVVDALQTTPTGALI